MEHSVCKQIKEPVTKFFTACEKGKAKDVIILLNLDDVNKGNLSGVTPFSIACWYGHTEVVKILVNNQKIDVNKENKDGNTPFYIACQQGKTEVVRILIDEQRIDVNKGKHNGSTPLHVACQKGHVEVVRIMINHPRIDYLDKCNSFGATPVYIACEKGYAAVVDLLLQRRANIELPDHQDKTPFFIACQLGHADVVDVLLRDKRMSEELINKPDKEGHPPFFEACGEKKCLQVVKLLLRDSRVDVTKSSSKENFSPLMHAVGLGGAEIVTELLDSGRPINIYQRSTNTSGCIKSGSTALTIASSIPANHKIISLLTRAEKEEITSKKKSC